MALFLGKNIGRPLLRCINNSKLISAKLNGIGKFIHRINPRFTPGLTRETFRLWEKCDNGDKIKILPDGFYRHNKKIAGNEYVSALFNKQGVNEFSLDPNISPEMFLNQSRSTLYRIANFINSTLVAFPIMLLMLANQINRGIDGFLPSFISEHIGNPIPGAFLAAKIFSLNPVIDIAFKFSEKTKRAVDYTFWGLCAGLVCLSETYGLSCIGGEFFSVVTEDAKDLFIPMYLTLSFLFADRGQLLNLKNLLIHSNK